MKIASIVAGFAICLAIGLFAAQQDADADQVTAPQTELSVFVPQPEMCAKKCSFNSDCPYGKCKGGQCGACGFDSDCKGWGKCKGGQCGGCGFDSECKGFGKCSGGKCTKSPY